MNLVNIRLGCECIAHTLSDSLAKNTLPLPTPKVPFFFFPFLSTWETDQVSIGSDFVLSLCAAAERSSGATYAGLGGCENMMNMLSMSICHLTHRIRNNDGWSLRRRCRFRCFLGTIGLSPTDVPADVNRQSSIQVFDHRNHHLPPRRNSQARTHRGTCQMHPELSSRPIPSRLLSRTQT